MVCQKNVVEEVSGWLRVFDDGSVDRTWMGPPQVKFLTEPVPAHPEFVDGVAINDVAVDEKTGLRVRIYLPEVQLEGEKQLLPIILHFHGGGFCITRADWYMYYHVYARLALSARAICVSVFLRLAPEHRLPAACEDGYAALLWLRDVAMDRAHEPWLEQYGDFGRVFLIGDSSGGNIVHEVAAKAGSTELGPMRMAGGIPIHPGFVRPEKSQSELEQPESPFLTRAMVDKFLSLALPLGSNKNHPITCPMGEAAPPLRGLNLPPMLLCVAERDMIKDTEMEYYDAMREAGKDIELLVNRGMGHSFYLNKIAVDMDPDTKAQTHQLILGIKDFIERH
ncbi:probable carboxylesterase 6 [Malania oleifera]|uniref:probable carboxylesterase 6 n=1 Tax=Malania oleifera TaxID=397392 RepID=UPI0025AEA28A|nr:probable carboxylesterase 6 [Malania oleifera]